MNRIGVMTGVFLACCLWTSDALSQATRPVEEEYADHFSRSERTMEGIRATEYTVPAPISITGDAGQNRRLFLPAQPDPSVVEHAFGLGMETRAIHGPDESWIDPEIGVFKGMGLLAWQDAAGDIWTAPLEPRTGLPVEGAFWHMGGDAASLRSTFNGPEFGINATDWAVFYSRDTENGIQVAQSQWIDGAARVTILTRGEPEFFSPMGSKAPQYADTRLVMLRRPPSWGTAVWMDSAVPQTVNELFPIVDREDADIRWIDDTLTLVTNNHPNAPGRISLIDTQTGIVQSAGDPNLFPAFPYGWKAPEIGGRIMTLGVVDGVDLVLWEQEPTGAWRRYSVLHAPPDAPEFIGSPEPVVVDNRSWISLTLADTEKTIPGVTDQQVWLFGIDPANSVCLRCDDGADEAMTRVDPEVFVGFDRVFVYYYVLDGEGSTTYRTATSIPSRSQIAVRMVSPQDTDPRIEPTIGDHYVARGHFSSNRLLVFLPGTGGRPDQYSHLLRRAAELGYHAIGLAYHNEYSINFDICAGAPSAVHCHERARREILMGEESGFDPPAVDPDNGVFNRLAKILEYLADRFPDEGWAQYLEGEQPRWERIVVAGHSQGGGHAAMIAMLKGVAGALLFGATEPAPWTMEAFATPPDRLWGLAHAYETSFDAIVRSWEQMGLPGSLVNVDESQAPFEGSHRLVTTRSECRGDPDSRGLFHNCPVVDEFTPLSDLGSPKMIGVWDVMLKAVRHVPIPVQ